MKAPDFASRFNGHENAVGKRREHRCLLTYFRRLRHKVPRMGFTGGVSGIEARGNAYTASATVQDFVFLKTAETTLVAGGSFSDCGR